MKYLAAVLFVLGLLTTVSWFAYDYGYNKSEAHWQSVRADAEQSAREAFQQVVKERDKLQGQVVELGEDYAKQIAALRDDHKRALRRERMRTSLNAACDGESGAVSDAANPASRDNDSSRGNELRRKIGEELERTALIADMQAARLIGCQRFVRIISE